MKIQFIIFCLFAFSFNGFAQTPESEKFLTALFHLQKSEEINKDIKQVYKKYAKMECKTVKINLGSKVRFHKLFSSAYDPSELSRLGADLTFHDNDFIKQNRFNPFGNPILAGIIEKNDSRLFLTFSKPIDSFLLAEITLYDPGDYSDTFPRHGTIMQILFKYNSQNLVEEVLTAVVHAN
ncbi:MAG: hypothetical protein AAF587_40635 [Bacteroidota bacterium]